MILVWLPLMLLSTFSSSSAANFISTWLLSPSTCRARLNLVYDNGSPPNWDLKKKKSKKALWRRRKGTGTFKGSLVRCYWAIIMTCCTFSRKRKFPFQASTLPCAQFCQQQKRAGSYTGLHLIQPFHSEFLLSCLLIDILTTAFFSLSELPDYLFTMPWNFLHDFP